MASFPIRAEGDRAASAALARPSLSRRAHGPHSIDRGPRACANGADGVFGTHRVASFVVSKGACEWSYRPPRLKTLDNGPDPKALCACTVMDQFGFQSSVKLALSVVPETVCV